MGKYMESHHQHPILAQVVHVEEKITKKGVLRRTKRIVEEDKGNKQKECRIATYDSKGQSRKKLKVKWQQKKLHGQYLMRANASENNKKSTHNWLRLGKHKIETEAFITAPQVINVEILLENFNQLHEIYLLIK